MARLENDLPAGLCLIFVGVILVGFTLLPDSTDGDQTSAVVIGTLLLLLGCAITIKELTGIKCCPSYEERLGSSHEYTRFYGIDDIP